MPKSWRTKGFFWVSCCISPTGVGYLAASSVWTAVRAIASCGWFRYVALSVKAEEPFRMNESIHGECAASELQDQLTELRGRVTGLIEQQTAISEVLRAGS
jgi:hypothetical protein